MVDLNRTADISATDNLLDDTLAWFGEPLQHHLTGMLQTAKMLELDVPTLIAIEYLQSHESLTKLSERFGEESARLIKGYQALELARTKAAGGQTESLRKMLLAFSQDLRVVLMYLASRLQTLRWVIHQKLPVEKNWAQEILEIDASLANRLGIWQIKWEMEDLAFRVVHPTDYQKIAKLLDSKRITRQRFVEDIVGKIQNELFVQKIAAQVYGRPKHIYSIWRKMQGKEIDFSHLYDVSAVRVIVEDVKECYAVLGIVHHLWQALNEEFDDYIAKPKPNGYQSLHTVVKDAQQIPFEIQIRTQAMHHQAEYGVAAHWRYKENIPSGSISAAHAYERKVAWARQLIAWKEDAWDQLKGQAIDDQVYALTPLGRVIALDKNATPLDFAYSVHTNIGHRCRGAKVDGVMVPLDTVLRSGQTVEIITTKEGGPSRDWLSVDKGYLATNRAKSKVKAWFNALDQESIKEEKSVTKEERIEKLELTPVPELLIKPSRLKKDTGDVLVVGVDSLLTQLSRCCRPVPPDAIQGFVTRGRGVSIHRSDCVTFKQLLLRAPERIIKTAWSRQDANAIFSAEIRVQAIDRQSLLRDISEVFSKLKINVIGVNTLSSKGMASMQFSIEIHTLDEMDQVIVQLSQVKGVTFARRK